MQKKNERRLMADLADTGTDYEQCLAGFGLPFCNN